MQEKKKDNYCNGQCAGIQYFNCLPGYGIFTTIEKIYPSNYNHLIESESSPPPQPVSNLDLSIQHNMFSLINSHDGKPKNEDIITKYGEYPKKHVTSKPPSSIRPSLSLQNMLEVGNVSVNTNNDFDQNTVIQPDKTYLMPDQKRIRNKSDSDYKTKPKPDVDLGDIIGGSWAGATDRRDLEKFGSLKQHLDKNENIKVKYSHMENGNSNTLRRNKSMNPLSHLLDSGSLKKNTAKFYTDFIENNIDESIAPSRKQENGKSKCILFSKFNSFYLASEVVLILFY